MISTFEFFSTNANQTASVSQNQTKNDRIIVIVTRTPKVYFRNKKRQMFLHFLLLMRIRIILNRQTTQESLSESELVKISNFLILASKISRS